MKLRRVLMAKTSNFCDIIGLFSHLARASIKLKTAVSASIPYWLYNNYVIAQAITDV